MMITKRVSIWTCGVLLAAACGSRTTNPSGSGGDSNGDDTQCVPLDVCAAEPCKVATSCTQGSDDSPECLYENLADTTICDLSAAGNGDGICAEGVCTNPVPISCDNNETCGTNQTCVQGFCVRLGGAMAPCDQGDDADCAMALVCGASQTCVEPPDECASNDDCAVTCIALSCAELGAAGETCDSGDDADCAENLFCGADNTCGWANGDVCSSNRECLETCVDGICTVPGLLGASCDLLDYDDCEGDLICGREDLCVLTAGNACTDNSQCLAACIGGLCAPYATDGEPCDVEDNDDCLNGSCFTGSCEATGETFVIEIDDHVGGTSTTLCEIEFYDSDGQYVLGHTTAVDAWDTTSLGVPRDWNSTSYWYRSNLFDGNTDYAIGSEGRVNCTGFHAPVNDALSGNWARFAVFLGAAPTISSIRFAAGSPDAKVPKIIRVYRANAYDYAVNILSRQNTNMDLVWSYEFTNADDWLTVDWVEGSF